MDANQSGRRPGTAIYPGTFDPITRGHLDIIGRAAKFSPHLIVAVHRNAGKGPLFDVDERVSMVRDDVAPLVACGHSIEVCAFDRLLIHFAQEKRADYIVRGLRAVSDFEYEFQMAGMNAALDRSIETVFLMASEKCQFIASRLVKEIARMGGDITGFVSAPVALRLLVRLGRGDAAIAVAGTDRG